MCAFCDVLHTGVRSKELLEKVIRTGYTLHKRHECNTGCNACRAARELLDWPDNVPLLATASHHSRTHVDILVRRFSLHVEQLPVPTGVYIYICLCAQSIMLAAKPMCTMESVHDRLCQVPRHQAIEMPISCRNCTAAQPAGRPGGILCRTEQRRGRCSSWCRWCVLFPTLP